MSVHVLVTLERGGGGGLGGVCVCVCAFALVTFDPDQPTES